MSDFEIDGGAGTESLPERIEAEEVMAEPALPQTDGMLAAQLAALEEKIDALTTLFARRLQYDEGKEKIIDKLHAELQAYKNDIYAKLTMPILQDLARLADGIRRQIAYLAQREVDTTELSIVFEDIEILLDKYEALPFTSAPGTKFSARRQRTAKVISTDNAENHGLVSESLASGYARGEMIILPEKVNLYKYEEAQNV